MGNRALRKFLEPYKALYRALSQNDGTLEEKYSFKLDLLGKWKAAGRRFLKEDPNVPGNYYEVSVARALEAIRQKLMETKRAKKFTPCPESPPQSRPYVAPAKVTPLLTPKQTTTIPTSCDTIDLPLLDSKERKSLAPRLKAAPLSIEASAPFLKTAPLPIGPLSGDAIDPLLYHCSLPEPFPHIGPEAFLLGIESTLKPIISPETTKGIYATWQQP